MPTLRFFFASLRTRLVLLVLLAVLPALGLLLHTYADMRAQAAATVQQDALELSQRAVGDHAELVESTHQLLIALAQLPQVRNRDAAGCSTLFANILQGFPAFGNLGAVYPNGDVYCSAVPTTTLVNVADRLYFQRAMQTRNFAVGDYALGRITGKASLTLAYPVLEATLPQGIVFVSIDLAWFNHLAAEAQLPRDSSLTIFDSQGIVLARYPDSPSWVGQALPDSNLVKTVLSQRSGAAELPGPDGVTRLYAFSPLRRLSGAPEAFVSIGIPAAAAYADVDQRLARDLAAFAIVAVLALAAAWFAGNFFIMRRLTLLMNAARRLAAGDLRARSGLDHSLGEIGILAQTFDRMAESLQQHTQQIEQQLARLGALRSIDVAITSSLDLQLTLNLVLEQVTAHLRVDAADILLLEPHTHMLRYASGRGFRTVALKDTRLRLGEGYAGRAALERELVSVCNLNEAADAFVRSPVLPHESFVTYYAAPLIAKGQVLGVLEIFHRAPLTPDDEWLRFLETVAGQAAIAIDSATLFGDLQRSNVELALAYDTTLEGWSRALDLRDKETEGHTLRVTEMTVRLAKVMGLGDPELTQIRRGALLHDIGKMGIPDSILLKPGPLTDEEWVVMRRHPRYAHNLLAPVAYLKPALDIPYCHHEKWDGTGYPQKLRGEAIPLGARIFAVVDVWDALSSDRPYRPAWAPDRVREYIRAQAGTHFDPRVSTRFLNLLESDQYKSAPDFSQSLSQL